MFIVSFTAFIFNQYTSVLSLFDIDRLVTPLRLLIDNLVDTVLSETLAKLSLAKLLKIWLKIKGLIAFQINLSIAIYNVFSK